MNIAQALQKRAALTFLVQLQHLIKSQVATYSSLIKFRCFSGTRSVDV